MKQQSGQESVELVLVASSSGDVEQAEVCVLLVHGSTATGGGRRGCGRAVGAGAAAGDAGRCTVAAVAIERDEFLMRLNS